MKLICRLFFLFGLLAGTTLSAQNTFYITYDPSPGNQVYFGGFQRILPTPDNGFIALSGVYERVVAKLNANMEIEWSYKFDLPGTQTTYGLYDMTISNDNKILILGFGGAGDDRSFMAKLELDGTLIWKKDIRSNHSICGFYLNGKQILNAYDNGFLILGGTSEGKSMVLRMDMNGDAVWAKVYDDVDDTGTARFNYGVHDGNNAYMLQASMRSVSFVTMDDNGNITSKVHHDDGRSATYPKVLTRAGNGDYYSVGQTRDTVNNERRHILSRVNSAGTLIWTKEVDIDSTFEMYEPYAIDMLPSNEVVVVGYVTRPGSAGRRTQVSRFDVSGNHLGTILGWNGGYEYLYGGTLHQGNLYLAGISLAERNMIAKVDLTGAGMCNGGSVGMTTMDLTPSITFPNDQVTVANMPTSISDASWDLVPYTYTRTVVCGSTTVGTTPETADNWKVYPQPAQDYFRLEHPVISEGQITLMDLSGRLIWEKQLNTNTQETEIGRGSLPAGVYLFRAQGDGQVFTQRVVLQ